VNKRNRQLKKEVREKLLPMPWWVRFLEGLLLLLPRKWICISLSPLLNIKPIDTARGEWAAMGADSRFSLKWESDSVRAGWYYLEAALTRHAGDRVAKLYVDLGDGTGTSNAIPIPSNRRGSIREVFYLPRGVKALFWSPCQSPGRFTQSPLIIHRISRLESFYRRLARVLFDRYRNDQGNLLHGSREIALAAILFSLQHAYLRGAERRLSLDAGVDYEDFIRINDTLSDGDKQAIAKQIPTLPHKPLISIVMPVYNPSVDYLRQALDSVLAQLYPHWELCIADDASTQPGARETLEEYRRNDPRIRVTHRNVNGHISQASNSALELATGDFVALMDQDDLMPVHALYHVAVEINRFPELDLMYSDEDKIDQSGRRYDPYFKSDWNPELFYSQNMFSHLGVYRTSLVRRVGGFRVGFEGSQDYDLVLRCMRQTSPGNIRHIPRVLYHWRAHADSTAQNLGNKDYAHAAGLRALRDHMTGSGAAVEEGPYPGTYHVRYTIPTPPLVSLIIPTRDRIDVLRPCIESIRAKTRYPSWEILLIDNQSKEMATSDYFAKLGDDPRIRLFRYDAPFNYSAINNFAANEATGEILGFVNNDIEVMAAGWLDEMVGYALRPEIGAVGARLLYPDGKVQHAGVVLGVGGLANHAHLYLERDAPGHFGRARLTQNFSAVTGACLLIRKSLFMEAGMFDELNLPVAFNDVDLCLRVRKAGFRNVYCPEAELCHHESLSRGAEDTPEKRARLDREIRYMQSTWSDELSADPYYNPNLSLKKPDFSLNTQPVCSLHHGYPLTVDVH
jgi:GT2 family glycosyltransferase